MPVNRRTRDAIPGARAPHETGDATSGVALKGTVFRIARFSVHDGPGIRTTVKEHGLDTELVIYPGQFHGLPVRATSGTD